MNYVKHRMDGEGRRNAKNWIYWRGQYGHGDCAWNCESRVVCTRADLYYGCRAGEARAVYRAGNARRPGRGAHRRRMRLDRFSGQAAEFPGCVAGARAGRSYRRAGDQYRGGDLHRGDQAIFGRTDESGAGHAQYAAAAWLRRDGFVLPAACVGAGAGGGGADVCLYGENGGFVRGGYE